VTDAVRRSLPVLKGKSVGVGLSGGVDSVVLLHALSRHLPVSAVHVHHGLSPNAGDWARFCRALCRRLGVPLTVRKVRVRAEGEGVEAAARAARYAAFEAFPVGVLALAHQLDDQAETVLMNLLRGAGARGASGIPAMRRLQGKLLVRPLLDVPREAIVDYARRHGLAWIEDETNALEDLTRNFVRRRIGPLLAERYPRGREALARAARHFSRSELDAQKLVRAFLAGKGLRAPSEAKLAEMVRQLAGGKNGALIEHDGARWRLYRGELRAANEAQAPFAPVRWRGEPRIAVPALGGEVLFRRVRGAGIDASAVKNGAMTIRLRSGGERLQPHALRPRRTLKNLFQEAAIPAWRRERLPLLFDGEALVWAPGLGVDVRYQAKKGRAGWLPQWRDEAGDTLSC
jgi:tRNA(Ile)-lysidine synthase